MILLHMVFYDLLIIEDHMSEKQFVLLKMSSSLNKDVIIIIIMLSKCLVVYIQAWLFELWRVLKWAISCDYGTFRPP